MIFIYCCLLEQESFYRRRGVDSERELEGLDLLIIKYPIHPKLSGMYVL